MKNVTNLTIFQIYWTFYAYLRVSFIQNITTMAASAPTEGFADTKPHYEILDGLRGVAALMVVWYHICEGYALAAGDAVITFLNHGYLAVDFFFILSGFVLGYAYDDRWAKGFTTGDFFKRRLIRSLRSPRQR